MSARERRSGLRRRATDREGSLERLLAAKEIVVTCGSGGVGKTTVAAALGAMAAGRLGGRVLVLTVDPARRLASALGLEAFGNVATRVDPAPFAEVGMECRGELWAAMLDTKQSWDDLVRRHAPDAATRDAILANPLYQNITGRFVQSHDYIAMERLYEIHTSGEYDLVIVDTPPTRHAIDFLEAPQRMADFFGSRLLRWLTAPYRSRLITFASKPFYQIADRILGTQFLEDIATFFTLFQSMEAGFVERAEAVSAVLANRCTSFVVVSTLETGPLDEAEFFMDALRDRGLHLGGLVLNRVLPAYLLDPDAHAVAERLAQDAGPVADALGSLGLGSASLVGAVLAEVGASFERFAVAAMREAEERGELRPGAAAVASVPAFSQDVADLRGLIRMGQALFGESVGV